MEGGSSKILMPLAALAAVVAAIPTGGTSLAAGAALIPGLGAAATAATGASTLGLIGAGLTAASSIAAAFMPSAQEGAMKAQAAQDRLEMATAERDAAQNLRRTLASQAVYYGARGVDPGSGSALQSALASEREAARESDLLRAQRITSERSVAWSTRNARINRYVNGGMGLLDVGLELAG